VLDEFESRVLGFPHSWFWAKDQTAPDLRWIRHPIQWSKWRLHVRRLGPYAPSEQHFGLKSDDRAA